MKNGSLFFKVASALIFIAILSYAGFYVYTRVSNPFQTAVIGRVVYSEVALSEGYIVREEVAVYGSGKSFAPLSKDGEKLAAGQQIGSEFEGVNASARSAEIIKLKHTITQLEAAMDIKNAEELREKERAAALRLSKAVLHSDLSEMDEIASEVESFVFYTWNTDDTGEELSNLRNRLQLLEAGSNDTTPIFARSGGIFSSVTDGYEGVSPAALTLLSPSTLKDLFPQEREADSKAVCKLINGIRWYYAAVLTTEEASKLERRGTTEVTFPGVGAFEMSVSEIGREENGKTVVVFVSSAGMADITNLRQTKADVTISELSGLRIPKPALRLDDDNRTYVFLLTGARAERVDVEIIGEFEGDYTVRDGADNGSLLRNGSEIIVKANDIYDGKVVLE